MGWSIELIHCTYKDAILIAEVEPPQIKEDGLIFQGKVELADDEFVQVVVRYCSEELATFKTQKDFRLVVPHRPGLYRLEVRHPSGACRTWDIVDRTIGPHALPGSNGQLFLSGDNNDSLGQFTKKQNLSEASIKAWEKIFEMRHIWCDQFNLAHCDLLIAPAKEENFRDYYPQPRAQHTVLDDFIARFTNKGVIFPKWPLWNRRELAWSRTDTHWTDFGATVAATEVLKAWNIDLVGLPESFRVVQRIGDLGSKVVPMISSHEMTFPVDVPKRKLFDNGVRNQGNIRAFYNSEATLVEKLVIFGDSFGTNLAEAFTGTFSEVVYAYCPAGFDPLLVDIIRPRHVLLQITQRFLHGQPSTINSILNTAAAKISGLPDIERSELIARLRDEVDGPFTALVSSHMERL